MSYAIKLKCKCGAEAEFCDDRGSYISPGGKPDGRGFTRLIEGWKADWLNRHEACYGSREVADEGTGLEFVPKLHILATTYTAACELARRMDAAEFVYVEDADQLNDLRCVPVFVYKPAQLKSVNLCELRKLAERPLILVDEED